MTRLRLTRFRPASLRTGLVARRRTPGGISPALSARARRQPLQCCTPRGSSAGCVRPSRSQRITTARCLRGPGIYTRYPLRRGGGEGHGRRESLQILAGSWGVTGMRGPSRLAWGRSGITYVGASDVLGRLAVEPAGGYVRDGQERRQPTRRGEAGRWHGRPLLKERAGSTQLHRVLQPGSVPVQEREEVR